MRDTRDTFYFEDYRHAKAEILSTIELQHKILSLLITATAAVFVYILDKDENELRQLVFCACLIVPGLFSFFGALWLDQVYRQRRLAAYVFQIETLFREDADNYSEICGWEHFVQVNKREENKEKGRHDRPSRFYYQICMGLFFCFPVATYFLACYFRAGNVFSRGHELHWPAMVGVLLYLVFAYYAIRYIRSIKKLDNKFYDKSAIIEDRPSEDQLVGIH